MNEAGTRIEDMFEILPDPGGPEWVAIRPARDELFYAQFGTIRLKAEGPARVRCRVEGKRHHQNILGTIHGGFALALIDQSLFLAPHILGIKGGIGGLTLDVSTQFFGPLQAGKPIDAVVDVLRETGRLIFMRGLIEQDGEAAMAFSGTIRKASTR